MGNAVQWWQRPAAPLSTYIDRYWGWEGPVRLPPAILPGTGAECLFHYGEPFRFDDGPALPASLICPRNQPIRLTGGERVGFIAVRFRSGRLRHLCAQPFAELHDQHWPVETLWGDAALRLSDTLSKNQNRAEQVAALDAFFLDCLARHEQRSDAALDALLDRLYYAPSTSIETLADYSGWSRRHLLRKFTDLYGLSPKRFARQSRLNHTLRMLALQPEIAPLDAALQMGYFDQAHFIHETRALTGHSPQQIADWLHNSSHFYNPPSRPAI